MRFVHPGSDIDALARWVSRKRVAGLWRAFTVDAVTRFITLRTKSLVLCAMLCITSLVLPSAGSAQQTRQPELEGFYGELALIDRTDSQIQKGLATAHPRLALLTPPLGSARRPGSPSASTVGTGELDEHEALLRKAKTQIRLGSTFLAVSAVLSLTGSLILVNGTIGEEDCWSSNGGNCASTGSGMAVMALGGLGIIGSAVALRRGRRSKRELERERAATSLQLSPTSASVVLRF